MKRFNKTVCVVTFGFRDNKIGSIQEARSNGIFGTKAQARRRQACYDIRLLCLAIGHYYTCLLAPVRIDSQPV